AVPNPGAARSDWATKGEPGCLLAQSATAALHGAGFASMASIPRICSGNYAAYASATGLWAGKLSGFGELHALDHDVLDRTVAPARRLRLDRVDRVHAVRHAAEHGVLAVEPRRGVGRDDEELAAVGVRPRVRHRER